MTALPCAAASPLARGFLTCAVRARARALTVRDAAGTRDVVLTWCVSVGMGRLYRVSVVLTTVCTWMLWACCYMSQMYPIL